MDNYFARYDTDATQLVARLLKQYSQAHAELHIKHDFHCHCVYYIRNRYNGLILAQVYFQHFIDPDIDSFFTSVSKPISPFISDELPF